MLLAAPGGCGNGASGCTRTVGKGGLLPPTTGQAARGPRARDGSAHAVREAPPTHGQASIPLHSAVATMFVTLPGSGVGVWVAFGPATWRISPEWSVRHPSSGNRDTGRFVQGQAGFDGSHPLQKS